MTNFRKEKIPFDPILGVKVCVRANSCLHVIVYYIPFTLHILKKVTLYYVTSAAGPLLALGA